LKICDAASWRGFANRALPHKGKELSSYSKQDTGGRPAPAGGGLS